ncbi:hypothetical protein [Streptomyces hirsutus]|uniref:hypothetical protein n=1 Tax=Streptomyces hirsutus TaxID=35620 RepID=UPI0033C531FC
MTNNTRMPVVVTGVASGIGAATGRLLDAEGVPLIGIDRSVPDSFPGTFVQADLSSPAGAREAARAVLTAARTASPASPTSPAFPAPRPGAPCSASTSSACGS